MKIGCIGTGAMGGAIMRAVCKKYDVSQIKVTDKNTEMGKAFAAETGATFVENNVDVLDCDYIFLVGKKRTETIYDGVISTGFDKTKVEAFDNLQDAMNRAMNIKTDKKKYILLENDLPDNY